MATKKQKRARGIAKREAFEAEQRASGIHFLKLAQTDRAEQKRKADEARKERAKAKSKRLAREHKQKKEGLSVHQPPKNPIILPHIQRQVEFDSGL